MSALAAEQTEPVIPFLNTRGRVIPRPLAVKCRPRRPELLACNVSQLKPQFLRYRASRRTSANLQMLPCFAPSCEPLRLEALSNPFSCGCSL